MAAAGELAGRSSLPGAVILPLPITSILATACIATALACALLAWAARRLGLDLWAPA